MGLYVQPKLRLFVRAYNIVQWIKAKFKPRCSIPIFF